MREVVASIAWRFMAVIMQGLPRHYPMDGERVPPSPGPEIVASRLLGIEQAVREADFLDVGECWTRHRQP